MSVANVYIGWDPREVPAYQVAEASLRHHASIPVRVTPLRLRSLELAGLIRRPYRRLPKGRAMVLSDQGIERRIVSRAASGILWDEISMAPMATEFANSRFLTPVLAQRGWALFVDCDVLFMADVAELLALADPQFAVMCVQHGALNETGEKMDGQIQLPYKRKNWSSVMLFNCDHPANMGLTLEQINKRPGRDLHRFCWLDDSQIGALPAGWNWLVGVQPEPKLPKIAHYTLGGPWITNWTAKPYDDLWLSAAENLGARELPGHA